MFWTAPTLLLRKDPWAEFEDMAQPRQGSVSIPTELNCRVYRFRVKTNLADGKCAEFQECTV